MYSSSFAIVAMEAGEEKGGLDLENPNLEEALFLATLSYIHLPHLPSCAVGFGQLMRSTSSSLRCLRLHRHVHGACMQMTSTTTNITTAAMLRMTVCTGPWG